MNDSAASSSPDSSSGVTPARRARPRRSRRDSSWRARSWLWHAHVRLRARRSRAVPYSRSTSTVRSIASGARARVRSTPWPRRVMRMRRSSGRSFAFAARPVGVGVGTSGTSKFVPMSTAATRVIAPPLLLALVLASTSQPEPGLLTPVGCSRLRAGAPPMRRRGRCRRRGRRRSGRGGTSRPCGTAHATVRTRAGVARRDGGVSLGRVHVVRRLQGVGIDGGLGRAHAPADSSRDTDTDNTRSTSQ